MLVPTSSPPRLAIAPATEADLPLVERLANAIWREYYPAILSAAQIDYMLARGYSGDALAPFVRNDGAGLAILSADGAPAGFAAWYRAKEPSTTKLDKLYVDARTRGSGGGRALIAHVEEAAQRDGSRTLILNVNRHNAKSIAAYRACGFALRGEVVVDIGNGFVMDDYVMAKPLASGGSGSIFQS